VREYEMLEPAEIVYRADRAIERPQGLRGGKPAGPSCFVVNPGTPNEQSMPSSARMQLEAGTVFRVNGPGGGGYGDPANRDPDAIANDIAEGYISEGVARRDYG
jgi:N-methylhydantoinase B